MTEPIPVKFDVTDALPANVSDGRRIEIAAWLFLPDSPASRKARPTLITLLHGGSYDKRYHDIQIPGRPGYSCARHLAALGHFVLLPDVLGVSESTRLPVQSKADRHICALANHAAVTQCMKRLGNGTMLSDFPPMHDLVSIGGGHSIGGMLTVTQQAAHRTYAGIMIIGFTAVGVRREYGSGNNGKQAVPGENAPRDYILADRERLRGLFHWPDVPADVIAADDALCVEVPAAIGRIGVTPGVIAEDAANIEVPVYICQSELDNSPDPHAEPACYCMSRDITLHILDNAAHCQNFASSRQVMWDRMHHWARGVANTAHCQN